MEEAFPFQEVEEAFPFQEVEEAFPYPVVEVESQNQMVLLHLEVVAEVATQFILVEAAEAAAYPYQAGAVYLLIIADTTNRIIV